MAHFNKFCISTVIFTVFIFLHSNAADPPPGPPPPGPPPPGPPPPGFPPPGPPPKVEHYVHVVSFAQMSTFGCYLLMD
uniref:Uncharacterized protein n=1 Tax=Parascaris equorum TaxID=6256 RepID=A0A914SA11_PAREQ